MDEWLEEEDSVGAPLPAGDDDFFLVRTLEATAGQAPIRLDRFVTDRLENSSRSFIQGAIGEGLIRCNGVPLKASYRVKPLDRIEVWQVGEPREIRVDPEPIPLDIVYEDEDLLIVNKPAGMVVHPGHGHFSGTLINALLYHCREQALFQEGGIRPGLAHRIDKDTSGLLAVGKSARAMDGLGNIFLKREAHREYVALVWGSLPSRTGTIDAPVARDPRDRQRMHVTTRPAEGKEARTHWMVDEELLFTSLIRCRLDTGRMHQIRVHMAHIGHPLFGDGRYGGDVPLRGVRTGPYMQFVHGCLSVCPRQALHAHRLTLPHPISGSALTFEAPLPPDMEALVGRWREATKGGVEAWG